VTVTPIGDPAAGALSLMDCTDRCTPSVEWTTQESIPALSLSLTVVTVPATPSGPKATVPVQACWPPDRGTAAAKSSGAQLPSACWALTVVCPSLPPMATAGRPDRMPALIGEPLKLVTLVHVWPSAECSTSVLDCFATVLPKNSV
jgi:hypothetical protein